MSTNLKLVTPIGTAVYPKLVEPDTAFDEVGVYTCKLHVSEEEFEAFKAKVDVLATAAYDSECQRQGKTVKKAKSCPVRITEDGDYEILAKQKARSPPVLETLLNSTSHCSTLMLKPSPTNLRLVLAQRFA